MVGEEPGNAKSGNRSADQPGLGSWLSRPGVHLNHEREVF